MTKLQQIRQQRGMSVTELARKSKVAYSYIYEIEQGSKSPTIRTLQKLAVALGVKVSDLLDEELATGTVGR
ncbi:helix-turn-helix domain-containing protein [Desulfofundulus thermobenzoicus]|uniref:Helix-turn-helix domain-containing protein n=1 Tax=Desulfofundulus thermobenzoicus TaxID=29376 RepID=A0A6N7IU55_9FIRM|nr:helix-turn-helix transcriptional regulator [Desulfofundulus thermobenzoicus]MQL53624.1 helix-turn-helix domain-containing protein [Desulfofundulus thermobenzoicus]